MELTAESEEKTFPRGGRYITTPVWADSIYIFRSLLNYDKGKRKPSSTNIFILTKTSRSGLLPSLIELHEKLKNCEPVANWNPDRDSVSFRLNEPYDLDMHTGYGIFKLVSHGPTDKELGITPYFNLAEFIAPIIAKAAIVEGIPEAKLRGTLEKILSKLPKLKSIGRRLGK